MRPICRRSPDFCGWQETSPLYGEPLTEYGKCYEALEFLIEGVLARLKEEEEQ